MAYDAPRQNTLYDELRFILHRCSNAPQYQIEVYSSVVDALAMHSYLLAGTSAQSWSMPTQQFQPEIQVNGAARRLHDPPQSVVDGAVYLAAPTIPENTLSDAAASTATPGRLRRRKRANKSRAAQHKEEHDKLRQGLLPTLRRFSGQKPPQCSNTLTYPKPSPAQHCIPQPEPTSLRRTIQGPTPPLPKATLGDRNHALGLSGLGQMIADSNGRNMQVHQLGTRPSVRLVDCVDGQLTPPLTPTWMQHEIRRSVAGMKEEMRW